MAAWEVAKAAEPRGEVDELHGASSVSSDSSSTGHVGGIDQCWSCSVLRWKIVATPTMSAPIRRRGRTTGRSPDRTPRPACR